MSDDDKKDKKSTYQVGYGKPPKATQFKPGQSGNPKGRPKAKQPIADVFLEEVGRMVKVKAGDHAEWVSKERGLVRNLTNMAMSGNMAAARIVIGMIASADVSGASTEEELSPAHRAILEDWVKLQEKLKEADDKEDDDD